MTYDDACEYVYGEPYGAWKTKHQTKATEAQLKAFEANRRLHARHDGLDMDRAKASGGGDASAGGGLTPINASAALSEVCCEPADALLACARRGDEARGRGGRRGGPPAAAGRRRARSIGRAHVFGSRVGGRVRGCEWTDGDRRDARVRRGFWVVYRRRRDVVGDGG
jgi:hypothetical protein